MISLGKFFENEVVDYLRALGWKITVSERLDLVEKTDWVVSGDDDAPLMYSIDNQFTLRTDDAIKMDRFLRSRNPHRLVTSVYAEADGEHGADAREVAHALSAEYQRIRELGPQALATFGVRITMGKPIERYDLQTRVRALWDRFDAEWSDQNRAHGVIGGRRDGGIFIWSDGQRFWAFLRQIADRHLDEALEAGRDVSGWRVSFVRGPGVGQAQNANNVKIEPGPIITVAPSSIIEERSGFRGRWKRKRAQRLDHRARGRSHWEEDEQD